jgi:Uma2 family endonuclease
MTAGGKFAMNQTRRKLVPAVDAPEPTWDIARLFPAQGQWSEDEYLALDTNRLVEFSHGFLEVLPMATTDHQLLVGYLYGLLLAFATTRDLGMVLFAPVPIRLWREKFREPDVVFMRKEHSNRIGKQYWKGADLAMEVVSEGEEDRRRDLDKKRREYARASIPEYWIIDPKKEQITVLRLIGKRYAVHGEFAKGEVASSHLLPGFTVDVSEAFVRGTLPSAKAPRKSTRRPRP